MTTPASPADRAAVAPAAAPAPAPARGAPDAPRPAAPLRRAAPWLLALSIGAALAVLVPATFGSAERVVVHLSDDAFYYFGIARHLAAGDGPSFDGLTRTTGFHPLYAGVLAAAIRLGGLGEDGVPAFALGFNTACFLLTGLALAAAARRFAGAAAATLAALAWYTNPHAVILALTGMEGSLYALAVALLAWLGARVLGSAAGRAWADGLALGAAGVLCYAARTDSVLVLGVFGLVLLAAAPGSPASRFVRVAVFGALVLAALLLWTSYCASVGGTVMQGSATIKTLLRREELRALGPPAAVLAVLAALGKWVFAAVTHVPLLKFVLPFAARPRRALLVLAGGGVLALGLAYAVALPRHWTWYFAPTHVLLTLVAAACLDAALRLPPAGRLQRLTRAALPLLLALTLAESYGYLALKAVRGRNNYQQDMLAAARWIRAELPPDARVGAWNSGIYGWYSGRTVVNLDGLVNNEIAPVALGRTTIMEYIDARRIGYLVDYDEHVNALPADWRAARLEVVHHARSAFRRRQDVTVARVLPPPALPAP